MATKAKPRRSTAKGTPTSARWEPSAQMKAAGAKLRAMCVREGAEPFTAALAIGLLQRSDLLEFISAVFSATAAKVLADEDRGGGR